MCSKKDSKLEQAHMLLSRVDLQICEYVVFILLAYQLTGQPIGTKLDWKAWLREQRGRCIGFGARSPTSRFLSDALGMYVVPLCKLGIEFQSPGVRGLGPSFNRRAGDLRTSRCGE